MAKRTDLCFKCFKPMQGGSVCPHCGYDQNTPTEVDQLPGGTVLASRYIVGCVRGNDDSGYVYNIYDLKKNRKRRMREYYPFGLCTRGADGSVEPMPGSEGSFNSGLKKLQAKSESSDNRYLFIRANGTGYFIEKSGSKTSSSKAKASGSGKAAVTVVIAVAALALVIFAATRLFGNKTDNTSTGIKLPTPVEAEKTEEAYYNPLIEPTKTPYVYTNPTSTVSTSYNSWKAQQGGENDRIVTSTPVPTPTPYNQWEEIRREIEETWGSTETAAPTAAPTRSTVKQNSSPAVIRDLQWQLIELGWLEMGGATGVYDENTINAVKDFQSYINSVYGTKLTVDGLCGAKTFRYLDDYTIAYKPEAEVTPEPEDGTITSMSSPLRIRELQLRLIALGWFEGEADGYYGVDTMNAVMAFQNYVNVTYGNKLLAITGFADENTQLLLAYERFAKPTVTATPEAEMTPVPTATADPDDETDTIELFDYMTAVRVTGNTAVYERASVNSTVLGYVNAGETYDMFGRNDNWALLSLNGSSGYVRLDRLTEIEPEQSDEPENFVIDENSSAEDVKNLQQRLYGLGWLGKPSDVDGRFGKGTRAALTAFQNYVNQCTGYQRLQANGTADGDTLDLLLEDIYMNPAVATPVPTATPTEAPTATPEASATTEATAEPTNVPTATPAPEFTDVWEELYVRAAADGMYVYKTADVNDPWVQVKASNEFVLTASSDEWLKIKNPGNGAVAYARRSEFAVYSKGAPAEEPTSVPTAEPTSEPTEEPTTAPEPTNVPEPTATPLAPFSWYNEPAYGNVIENGVVMYKEADLSSTQMGKLVTGNFLTVLGDNGDWIKCIFNYNGKDYEGYVLSAYVVDVPAPTLVPTEEPTATPEPTPVPTEEPTATPEPTPVPTEEPTATPEPTPVPTEEPTATPEPTPVPYDDSWTKDNNAVKALQDKLINLGWLSRDDLDTAGEYGRIGEYTLSAIAAVQEFMSSQGEYFSDFIMNEDGSYNYFDEMTYNYILEKLRQF